VVTGGDESRKRGAVPIVYWRASDDLLETHVFVSLLTHKPVYVGTKVGIWCVNGDKIRFVDDRPPDGKD
jgi:hypothetical protein